MLETILSFLVTALGGVLDFVISSFLLIMDMDVTQINDIFPALAEAYGIFQGFAIGLIAAIAVFQLFKFFFNADATQDRPEGILARSVIATFLVWFAAYFLELIVNVAQIAYKSMLSIDAIGTIRFADLPSIFTGLHWGAMDTAALLVSPVVVLVLSLLLIVLIAWNCFKFMIEVCERYLMVFVLFYTCPLAFTALTSKSTSGIFQRWFSMFCGQCMLMTLSVWFMKLILSGFTFSTETVGLALRLLLTMAMCKIAQRVDTYLQQLGIGVGTTGGNLLGETMAMISYIRGGKKSGNSRSQESTILGEGIGGSAAPVGGVIGGVYNTAKKAYQQAKSGAMPEEVSGSMKENFREGFVWKDPFLRAVVPGAGSSEAGRDGNVAQAAVRGSQSFRDHVNASEKYKAPDGVQADESPIDYDVVKRAEDAHKTYEQYTQMCRDRDGVGGMEHRWVNGKDELRLNQTAQDAGLQFKGYNHATLEEGNPNDTALYDRETKNIIEGPDDRVGDFLANNYSEGASDPELNDVLIETVNQGSHLSVEQMVSNPYTETMEENDALGDAVIKRMFGEKNVTGQEDGVFSNVKIRTTKSGGRMVSADYTRDGKTSQYEIMDEDTRKKSNISDRDAFYAGWNHGKGKGLQMKAITSESTGAKWYAIRKEAKIENFEVPDEKTKKG